MGETGGPKTSDSGGSVGVSRSLRIAILITDGLILVLATLAGFIARFSAADLNVSLMGPIQVVGTVMPALWLVVLVLVGSYEQRVVGLGLSEYGRVVKSVLWMVGVVSVVSFLGKFDTSRAYVFLIIPLGLLGLLANRWLWRRWILSRRRKGERLQATIVVGDIDDQVHVSEALADRPWAGYNVVAIIDPIPDTATNTDTWFDEVLATIDRTNATCIALTPSCGMEGSDVRELSWRIEGRGIDLLISSALGAVTGPRLTLRVATGLPFMHLDEVGLGLSARWIKRLVDLSLSAVALVLLSPILLVIALLVLITSGTPVRFRQPRAGMRGEIFRMWKFRTMVRGADAQREQMRMEQEVDGPIAKFVDDPRITPLGKFLRRWSLDELPQLVNVFLGDMSLVGPRPHPIDDVQRYRREDNRRLLAKPGMTGLWQVAGRSDLSWEDAVELDLVYIENWSLLGDAAILARTVQAVISRSGAY